MIFNINIFNNLSSKRIVATILTAALVTTSAFATEASRRNQQGRDRNDFVVVIDAGHGGHDHGAVDNGTREKDINLGVAKKFAANIKKRLKNVKVVMTRDDDTFISLQERANIANRNRGNLFVSIHTNSVDKKSANRKSVSGTSVYALGPQKDANNLKVAQRENSVIELEDNYHTKYSGFDPSKDESYIIFEMAQKKNLGQSLKFADFAQKELVATAGRKDRGVKQAGFWVLWATSMPSVLVELDFICNPTEAEYLASESGQQKLADALTNSLKKYIASYKNPGTATKTTIPETKQNTSVSESEDVAETNNSQEVSNIDYDGVNTLVAADAGAKRTTTKAKATNNSNYGKARKRRSESSKANSEKRSHETTSIKLKYEQELLARQEVKEEAPVEKVEEQPANDKDKKRNKKKKKEKKSNKKVSKNTGITASGTSDSKADFALAADKQAGETNSKNGKKTFVVKSSSSRGSRASSTQTSRANTDETSGTNAARTSGASSVQTESGNTMVYKIQILASDKELDKNDSAFCGLTPTGMFKENGMYKYTYGESKNRREIEQVLMNVKSKIPDAFIIVRIE